MGQLYNKDRWNEFDSIYPLFNKGNGHRITYTVNAAFYRFMTSLGIKSYDTVGGKPLKHDGDDFIAITSNNTKLALNTYQVLMVFDSMKCVEVTRNATNTVVFEGKDEQGNIHQLRLAHGKNIIAEKDQVYKRGDMLVTVSDTGVVGRDANGNWFDNSHLHVTYKVNGKIKSLGALLSEIEPFPYVTAEGGKQEPVKWIKPFPSIKIDRVTTDKGYPVRTQPMNKETVYWAQKGDYLSVLELSDKTLGDGYKWAKVVTYGNDTGYIQIDLDYMHVEV
ncbi:hypothetical protein [Anaerorhabdus furcosa]|uniref:SH3 domain-containing protein n=1 Tax=Anaerorhabdus furcosa TaxID=118967 RepID=A0A1T4M1W7_9FIRM|nr:hypothetical protein [Anaerorhabdus furcosa]SJZ60932.1 hypothetical protein SAMN02745191_1149 [Anaerorhabdus furcosa]